MRMRRMGGLALALSLLLAGCTEPGKQADLPLPQPPSQSQQAPEPEPVAARLAVAGDVMSHMPITKDTYRAETGTYDYGHILQGAAPQLAAADYAAANLETVLAGGPNYSGFPTFNSPDALADGVRAAGLDLLSTANNHSWDQGAAGAFRTLDVLDEVGLAHVGTHRSQKERDRASGVYVADVGGISVAFLSYTYGLNGFRLGEEQGYAVNLFNLDYASSLSEPDYDLMAADLAAARAMAPDLIAVMIHWGVEYQNEPNHHQTELARFLVEQGADLVLGGHPHVLQPYETLTVQGWDGQERQGFVCYSLGNFISNQQELETRTTVVLELELTRDPVNGETKVTDVCYTPYYMLHRDDRPAGERRWLVEIHGALAAWEAGDKGVVDQRSYEQLRAALDHCHSVLGPEGDRQGMVSENRS
ncbi:MAG: CapA family protein [Oscillospiraceae bacterium]|nr:CapA family protein [Oscillospiraceae bacterium]